MPLAKHVRFSLSSAVPSSSTAPPLLQCLLRSGSRSAGRRIACFAHMQTKGGTSLSRNRSFTVSLCRQAEEQGCRWEAIHSTYQRGKNTSRLV